MNNPLLTTANIEPIRKQLLQFAMLQLRNDALAQDVVQDVLLVALEKPEAFSGKSQLQTWLIGILKYKILDVFRSQKRDAYVENTETEGSDFEQFENLLYDGTGHLNEKPPVWSCPDSSLSQKQFFSALEACVAKLPAQQARIFLMREWLELDTDDICKELQLSTSNVWTALHRARARLQECLTINWL